MNKDTINSHWWYRLLKVIYVISIILVTLVIFAVGITHISSENDFYGDSLREYNEQQRIRPLAEQSFEEYGSSLPAIDSLPNLSDKEKGRQAYYLTKENGSGRYFVNSLNHNGFHILQPNQIEIYQKIQGYEYRLGSLRMFSSEPTKPKYLIPQTVGYIAVGVLLLAIAAWLLRRLFYYIVVNDRFFRL